MKILLLTAFSFASFSFALSPCLAITHTLSGTMDVFQATTNAGNVGNGTGTISGDYDLLTNTLNYTIAWADLTAPASNIHFHLGAPGVAGGVVLPVPTPTPFVNTGEVTLGDDAGDSTLVNALIAGDWYVNVHTSMFGGGEIRGQVNVLAVPEPASGLLLGLACLFGLNGRRHRWLSPTAVRD